VAIHNILIVDDSPTERFYLTDILVKNGFNVTTAENGEEALNFLRNPANPRPCLILLDLNMPIMGGIEFLQIAKKDESLKGIPVVVLTTSEEQEDKVESFQLGVAGYMRKPVDYPQFVETIRTIDAYWTISELPQ